MRKILVFVANPSSSVGNFMITNYCTLKEVKDFTGFTLSKNEIFIWNKLYVYIYGLGHNGTRLLSHISFGIPIDESTTSNYIKRVTVPYNVNDYEKDIAITVSIN